MNGRQNVFSGKRNSSSEGIEVQMVVLCLLELIVTITKGKNFISSVGDCWGGQEIKFDFTVISIREFLKK